MSNLHLLARHFTFSRFIRTIWVLYIPRVLQCTLQGKHVNEHYHIMQLIMALCLFQLLGGSIDHLKSARSWNKRGSEVVGYGMGLVSHVNFVRGEPASQAEGHSGNQLHSCASCMGNWGDMLAKGGELEDSFEPGIEDWWDKPQCLPFEIYFFSILLKVVHLYFRFAIYPLLPTAAHESTLPHHTHCCPSKSYLQLNQGGCLRPLSNPQS